MAKRPSKSKTSEYYVPNFKDKLDPSGLLIKKLISTSSDRTSSVLSTGEIDELANSIRVPKELWIKVGDKLVDPYPKGLMLGIPGDFDSEGNYDYDAKSKMSSLTFMALLEQMGLVKNNPIDAPRINKRYTQNIGIVSGLEDVHDHFSFTPRFYDLAKKIKAANRVEEIKAKRGLTTGKPLSLEQALEDVGALPKLTTPIEGTVDKPKRKLSKKAQETKKLALQRQKTEEQAEEALTEVKGSKFERTVTPELQEKGLLPSPEAPEPEKLTNKQALDRILNDPREAELVEKGKLRSGIRAQQTLADMPLKKAEDVAREVVKGDASALERMGQFLSKNKGKIVRSVAPAVIGGGIGLAAKGAEALDYAMSSKPTGRDPEGMSTQQMEALLASVKGGGLTDEQRLATAEMPPEARQAEYLEKQLAERARPMEQGAAMQEDIQRSTRFQDEMKRLMERQQQKQGTAQ